MTENMTPKFVVKVSSSVYAYSVIELPNGGGFEIAIMKDTRVGTHWTTRIMATRWFSTERAARIMGQRWLDRVLDRDIKARAAAHQAKWDAEVAEYRKNPAPAGSWLDSIRY